MIDFPYHIIYTRNRNGYAKITQQGTVLFSIPKRWQHQEKVFNELYQKAEKLRLRHQKQHIVQQQNAEGIQIFGEFVARREVLGTDAREISQATLEKKLKMMLYEYAAEWLDIFSHKIDKSYKSLSIRKMKSRWGSCSHDERIVLNLSLIYLDRASIQYVIAHEVAHLQEKNHSPAFWSLVEMLYPNYKAIRKKLKMLTLREYS